MSSIFRNSVTFDNENAVEIPDIEFTPIFVPDEDVEDMPEEAVTVREEYIIEGFDMSSYTDEQRSQVGEFLTNRIAQIDQKAQDDAKIILQNAELEAKARAEQIVAQSEQRRDEIIKHAQMQTSEIFEKARQQGVKAGREEVAAQVKNALEELSQTLCEMKALQNDRFNSFDSQIKWLACDIASKVVCKKIDEDDLYLKELVNSAIKEAKEAQWLSVTLSSRLESLVEVLKAEYEGSDLKIEFDTSDTVHTSDVVVNGSDRQVVASVDEQLKNIREYFSSFDEFK